MDQYVLFDRKAWLMHTLHHTVVRLMKRFQTFVMHALSSIMDCFLQFFAQSCASKIYHL